MTDHSAPKRNFSGVWYRQAVGGDSNDCVATERLVQSGPNITSLATGYSQQRRLWWKSMDNNLSFSSV